MNIQGKPCPPLDNEFDYAAGDLTGRAREVHRCAMYLLIDYKGEGDFLEVFQDEFSRILYDDSEPPETFNIIATILYSQLVHFYDWFYDLAFVRLFSLSEDGRLGLSEGNYVKELFVELVERGYEMPKARQTNIGLQLLHK